MPSTTGATIPPLFTSGTRCAPEHTRRKLDGRRIDKETSTNEGCSTPSERRRKRDGESRGGLDRERDDGDAAGNGNAADDEGRDGGWEARERER